MSVLLLWAALAWGADSAGEGAQAVTVMVKGLEAGLDVRAERPGTGTITLRDPGFGYVQGTFNGTPSRFMQLRLTTVGRQGEREIFNGLVTLGDTRTETLAFAYDGGGAAKRIAVSPPIRTEYLLDPRITWWVSAGWGGLALLYVGFLGLAWAIRRR